MPLTRWRFLHFYGSSRAARRQSISTYSSRRTRNSPSWEHILYQSVPYRYGSRVLSQTNMQQAEKTHLLSSLSPLMQPLSPTIASTNLPAPLIHVSAFYKIIYIWADEEDRQDVRCIFWLNGLAGTGKSTVGCTVALQIL